MIKGRIKNRTIWEVTRSESEQMTSIDRSRKHEFTGMGGKYAPSLLARPWQETVQPPESPKPPTKKPGLRWK